MTGGISVKNFTQILTDENSVYKNAGSAKQLTRLAPLSAHLPTSSAPTNQHKKLRELIQANLMQSVLPNQTISVTTIWEFC